MLNEKDRNPADRQSVLDAILAVREVFPDDAFRIWADDWASGCDREEFTAAAIALHIRTTWLLFSDEEWDLLRIVSLIVRGADFEEIEAASAALEAKVLANTPGANPEAQAIIFAVLSAFLVLQAAEAYGSERLDPGLQRMAKKRSKRRIAAFG